MRRVRRLVNTWTGVEDLEARTLFATLVVTTAADNVAGSLREAIDAANTLPGPDTITFSIAPGGPQTLAPTSQLPAILETVTINATTQPGFAGSPIVQLTGTAAGLSDGLRISGTASNGSTVRGLVINNWQRSGIRVLNGSAENRIVGNWIGLNATGTVAARNEEAGVFLDSAGTNNRVGGTTAADRNVISGNDRGIQLEFSHNSIVQGNYVGTDHTGSIAVANGIGLYIHETAFTLIGGSGAGARNVISGNTGDGILLLQSAENVIHGNYIGSQADGTGPVPNFGFGVDVNNDSGVNLIGGPLTGEGNVIVHNSAGGINLVGSDNLVRGNSIGIDAANNPAGNFNHGITIEDGPFNVIGGTGIGEGNRIAFNGRAGIAVLDSNGNTIRGNSIFSNGGLGIDLFPLEGVTLNDPLDADEGPNRLQNFPVITSAASDGTQTTIAGSLHSAPSSTFTIELFVSAAPDPSGHGEGQTSLGLVTVTTDAAGDATFSVTIGALPAGNVITATATTSTGDTSEFSQAVAVTGPPPDGGGGGNGNGGSNGGGNGNGNANGHSKGKAKGNAYGHFKG